MLRLAALAAVLALLGSIAVPQNGGRVQAFTLSRTRVVQFELPISHNGATVGVLQHYLGNEPMFTARSFCAKLRYFDCDEDQVHELAAMVENRLKEVSRDYKVPLGAKEIDMLDAVRGMSHAEQEKIARMTNELTALREEQATLLQHVSHQQEALSQLTATMQLALGQAAPQEAQQLLKGSPQAEPQLLEDGSQQPTDASTTSNTSKASGTPSGTAVAAVSSDGVLVAASDAVVAAAAAAAGCTSSNCEQLRRHRYNQGLDLLSDAQAMRTTPCAELLAALPEAALAEGPGVARLSMLRSFTSYDGLGQLLSDMGLGGDGAMVGVWNGDAHGHMAAAILDKWRAKSPPAAGEGEGESEGSTGKVHVISAWAGVHASSARRDGNLKAFVGHMRRHAGRYTVTRKEPAVAVAGVEQGSLDWVYLTGRRHTYGVCRRRLQAWAGKVAAGGLVVGDGYMNGFVADVDSIVSGGGAAEEEARAAGAAATGGGGQVYGCRDAVDEFAAVYGLRVHSVGTGPDAHWYMMVC